MRLGTKILSVLMACCVLAANVSAQARSVTSLSDSSKRYGITANYRWWIDYSADYRNFNSKITTTADVAEISAGIYVYRMDNDYQIGSDSFRDTDYDECDAKYSVRTTAPIPYLKANASFYAAYTTGSMPIVNVTKTPQYVTEV